jgi:hypothetical protein
LFTKINPLPRHAPIFAVAITLLGSAGIQIGAFFGVWWLTCPEPFNEGPPSFFLLKTHH